MKIFLHATRSPFAIGTLLLLATLNVACGEQRRDQIDSAIEHGRSFLTQIQRPDGAIADTSNPLFDTWETILATQALIDAPSSKDSKPVKQALAYLKHNENRYGLVCHNQKCRAAICLETSAEYILLLKMIHPEADYFGRLIPVFQSQKENGAWDIGNPDVREDQDFPSVTGFVVGMLNACKLTAKDHPAAINWLLEKQKTAGHWGKSWEYYGCTAYALWPIMRALSTNESEATSQALQNASQYILSTQKADGSWNEQSDDVRKMPSPELQTALMLNALCYAPSKETSATTEKGIDFLLTHQTESGAWNGGFFPIASERYVKREYVVATALSILALKALRDAR